MTEKQFTNALESYESLREIPGVGDDDRGRARQRPALGSLSRR